MNTPKTDKKTLSKSTMLIVIILILAIVSLSCFAIYKVAFPDEGTGGSHSESLAGSDANTEIVANTDKYDSYMQKLPLKKTSDSDSSPEEDTTEPTDDCDEFVSGLMSQMSLSEKIYQLMFVKPETITGVGNVVFAGETTKNALSRYPIGGIIYFAYNLDSRDQTIQMIQSTQSYSAIPLFIAVDEEGGVVSRLGSNPAMGTTKQPPMADIGQKNNATEAYGVGAQLATDLKSLGFNVDFAPCADVLVNAGNTEIGNRSFGTDPNVCANMVKNVVLGLEENNVSATLKHFPGHASSVVNSHNSRSESTRTIDELRQCEFLPFKSGIDNGVDFIMVSHVSFVNATEEKVPSSLSKEVVTNMLKDELGYNGIIITDSMEMGAITTEFGIGQAAVKAINAGVDMLLMTPDVKSCHDSILTAIENGEISEERIDDSVRKILKLKYEKGLMRKK